MYPRKLPDRDANLRSETPMILGEMEAIWVVVGHNGLVHSNVDPRLAHLWTTYHLQTW